MVLMISLSSCVCVELSVGIFGLFAVVWGDQVTKKEGF